MSGSDTTLGTVRIDTEKDLGPPGDATTWAFWIGEDRIAGKEEEEFIKVGRKVRDRYRDKRRDRGLNIHRFNILWSNVQTLIPTLYARTPKPDVQRRFLDQDDVGRLASLLLERAISYSLENGSFDASMQAVVQDRLLPGRGVARVLYVPHYGDPLEDDFEADSAAQTDVANPGDAGADPLREVVYEEAIVDYVFWEDYREGAARTWREVPWIRYRAYMTRDQLIARFGKKKGTQVNLDFTPRGSEVTGNDKGQSPPDIFRKAVVHEYWDKAKKNVIWLAPGTPELVLDEQDDPLKLPDFYPSPDPLLATTTNDKRIPVPDYHEYKDQADELDMLTARIDILTQALKVSGIYPGALKESLQQLIGGDTENKLIPINDWMAFADKGGLENIIQYTPIKTIAETLIQLYSARDKTKELLYEITGLSDILRGQTNPLETKGAQDLKANFATRRIQPQQREVARMARDLIRLIGAVIAEHFSDQTISMITGYPQLQPVPADPGPMPMQFLPPVVQPMQPPGPALVQALPQQGMVA